MARKSILVVDDEKNQREILETILSSEGYDVTTASSGEAAMKFVQSRRFDLVLTDLKMTGMSGLDLLKELTNFDKSIIVILLILLAAIPLVLAWTSYRIAGIDSPVIDARLLVEAACAALSITCKSRTTRQNCSRPFLAR